MTTSKQTEGQESSEATQTQKGRGRPQKTTPSKPSFKIRREEKVKEIKEYRLVKKKGAIFILQQKNVTILEDGKLREIRYCPSEPSIYRDEQDEKSKRSPILFKDGVIFVRPDQPNLMEYLEEHPGNKANGGHLFYLVDEKKDKEQELEKEFRTHDAIELVRSKSLDDLLAVAVGYNINVDRPVAEIKHDLMVKAKSNPESFISSFDNPIVEMKAKIKQADKYQIIKLSEKGVYWYDTNKLILSVPAGKDPLDVMVRYCMTDAAAPVVDEIEKQLS